MQEWIEENPWKAVVLGAIAIYVIYLWWKARRDGSGKRKRVNGQREKSGGQEITAAQGRAKFKQTKSGAWMPKGYREPEDVMYGVGGLSQREEVAYQTYLRDWVTLDEPRWNKISDWPKSRTAWLNAGKPSGN